MKSRGLLLVAVAASVALGSGACSGPEEHPGTFGPSAEGAPVTSVVARAIAASLERAGGGVMEDGILRRRVALLAGEVARAAGVRHPEVTVLDTTDIVLRALPGNRLQLSRGLLLACAGTGARERLATLLAHACAHFDEELIWAAAAADGIAPVGTNAIAAIVAGEREAVGDALALGRMRAAVIVRTESGLCRIADRFVARTLARLGDPRPEETIREAYGAIAERDLHAPESAAPFVASHGSCAERIASASAGTVTPADREAGKHQAGEPLDLSSLVTQASTHSVLDAADLLTRRGVPEGALKLIGELRGARASTLRGEALAALNRDREAERALRAALLIDPDQLGARAALGALHVKQGSLEAARAELLEAVRRAPLDAWLHMLLAQAEDGDSARRARLELARALDPDSPAGRRAALELAPRLGAPEAPERDRRRILSGSGD